MRDFKARLENGVLLGANLTQLLLSSAAHYLAEKTPLILSASRDALNGSLAFINDHKKASLGISVSAVAVASLTAAFALHSPKEKKDPIDDMFADISSSAVITPQQQIDIRNKLNAEYKKQTKEKYGDAAVTPVVRVTAKADARAATTNTAQVNTNSPAPTHAKWNMDALFKYRGVIADGLTKLLHLDADKAFDKAVIVESGGRQFDDNGRVIKSHKDATGIAQVLPTTAQLIAERCTGAPLDNHRFYNDSAYNEKLGRCYYREQYQTFGNNTVLAALAYNTGPGNVDKHISRVGDPTKGDINMFDFIRTIPNTENRQYTLYMMKKGGLLDTSALGDDVYDHSYVPTTMSFNTTSRQGYGYRPSRLRFGYKAPSPKGTIVLQAYTTGSNALNAYDGKALSVRDYPSHTLEKN